MTASPARRPRRGAQVRAVLVAAVLVACGGALAAADAAVPPSASPAWLTGGSTLSGDADAVRQVSTRAAPAVLGCPAPPQAPPAEGTDVQFAPEPVETASRVRAVADAATTADLRVLAPPSTAAEPVLVADERGGVRLGEAVGAAAVRVVGAPLDADTPAAAAATAAAVTTAGDLRGLAAAACAPPRGDTWLVGAAVDVGRSALLVLSNPGATPAVADVTLLGGSGRTLPPAGQDVLVPPGDVVELRVEALTAPTPALAVGVSATGGLLSAFLVDSAVRGLVPAGVEVVSASEPATRHVVPGVPAAPDTATLRIAVPGDTPAVVGWRVEGTQGPLGGTEPAATTVPGGTVLDVPLGAVDAGPAAVVLESDVPVLTSVEVTRGGVAGPGAGGATERAWVGPAAPSTGQALLALPGGDVAAALVLSSSPDADGSTPAVVTVVPVRGDGVDGEAVQVAVAAGTTATVGADVLGDAVAVRVRPGAAPVHAAAVLTASSGPDAAGDLVSVVAVPAPVEPPGTVAVRSAAPGAWP